MTRSQALMSLANLDENAVRNRFMARGKPLFAYARHALSAGDWRSLNSKGRMCLIASIAAP